mmetsp:Transcript_26621/g.79420  ORF Transcript_26621/g.79420 Transcript_26621/m.79420 type:complete len:1165 (-) Transcript_26621:106-3600(-)
MPDTSGMPGAEEAQAALLTSVYFHIADESVSFGEVLRVVGNHPSLGDWDPARGHLLDTSEDIFPVWKSPAPISVEFQAKVEYKYVIVTNPNGVEQYRWETKEDNRTFTASGAQMVIEDDEGMYRQYCGAIGDDDDFLDDDASGNAYLGFDQVRSPPVRKYGTEEKLSFVKDLEGDANITTNDTTFMVSFQLPVNVVKNKDGKWDIEDKAPSDGRNFAFLPLVQEFRQKKKTRVVCVGWPGIHVENPRERHEIDKLLIKHDYITVWPGRQELEEYMKFCVTFLWPVFHDVMLFFQTANPRPFNEQGWAAYQHVNNIYANAVVPHTHEQDLIWIHDYHLLMTPTFISRKLIKANIGLYLHTPFPSSDSFKSLPVREELLSGMLCADQIGFQFFAYARNFLVSVKRIYGLDPTFRAGGFMGIDYNGRLIMIKVSHFSYPYKITKEMVLGDAVAKKTAEVKTLFEGKTVFASMDRCDNLSGLIPKFRAFKRLLKDQPQHLGKAVLVQYCFDTMAGALESSSTLVESLREMADAYLQADDRGQLRVVHKTGKAKSEEPRIFLRIEKVDRIDRLALFRAADILLDASVKAGLNLMPFEFITAHCDDAETRPTRQSSVILSEFSGCSRVLLGSVKINPWNTTELVSACARAIDMAEEERAERWESNHVYVADSSPMNWFEDFLADLRRARKKEGIRIESIGFGAKIRHLCVGQDFRKLCMDDVCVSYRSAKNRIFFLDNEGTLASDKRQLYREYGAPKGDVDDLKAHGSPPDEHVLSCLRALCADARNTVVILSGRDRRCLEEWFKSVPRICLGAERGFYYKLPTLTSDQWHCMKSNPDYTWKTYAFEIMRQFVKRTQGSFIENKGSALVWQYRNSDQHFGSWQAKELSSHLKELLFGFEVDVIEGKGYVEVKLRGINKGTSVTKLFQKVVAAYGEVDFVLCIGDDRSDEDMFEAVNLLVDPSEREAEAAATQDNAELSTDADSENSDRGPAPLPGRTISKDEIFGGTSSGPPTPSGMGLSSGSKQSPKQSGSMGGLAGMASLGGLKTMPSKGSFTLGGMKTSSGDLSSLLGGGGRSTGDQMGFGLPRRRFFTATVGRKPSAARFFIDDTDEVSELLQSLKSSGRRPTMSKEDLPSFHTWSGGDMSGKRTTNTSMPGLSSLSFQPKTRSPA